MRPRGRAAARQLCALSLALLAGVIAGEAAQAAAGRPLEGWRIARDRQRFEILNTDRLWEVLAIRPGMTVLDVGTGTGQFALAFAERVGAQGKVYATDINSYCLDYLKEQAASRRLTNIVPALVEEGRLDGFYRSDRYDVIAIFHLRLDYAAEEAFLTYLRNQLREDGRLILVLYKEVPDLAAQDFTGDFQGLAREIVEEPEGSPYYRAMSESSRESLRAAAGAEASEHLVKPIVDHFNAILANVNFGVDFVGDDGFRRDVAFTREERDYAEWFILPNNWRLALADGAQARWLAPQKARFVNKLLITQRYRRHLKSARLFASGLTPTVRDALARAGYVLEGEYGDAIPFEDIVIYTTRR